MLRFVRFFGLLCVVAALITQAPPRPAAGFEKPPAPVIVIWRYSNRTSACAWVTTYWSYKSEAHWRIVSGSPRWVGPHSQSAEMSETFNHPTLTPQVKFRAEVRPNAACSGSGGENVWLQRDFRRNLPVELNSHVNRQRVQVDLKGSSGRYNFDLYTVG